MRNLIGFMVICILGLCPPGFSQEKEVTIGAQIWAYDRVYPLLDGLLQDAASTQLQQLILDPNKANGSQVDALIQSFQLQAGFSQLSGVQNAAAAKMDVANLGYQSALTQQQQSIMQQSIAAQQALTKANQDLAAANQSQNQAQINAATLEVQNAQALVNGLTAEAAIVKGSGTPWTPSPASGNIASTPTAFTSGVPSGIVNSGSSSSPPSFPATKQLDNQMDLLWSRLARVVGAMARPDSIERDSRMYMIEFDTATFPKNSRKGRVLETRYSLGCGEVVDVFPRVAAVNVANTKYRDNADIFGVILSWFSFGINAQYNREHLKMSQTLGQSSYITGYGVDQNVFGWKFGIPLGDNFVSSDTKRTFALVSVPTSCSDPELALAKVIWEKPNGDDKKSGTVPTNFAAVNKQLQLQTPEADSAAAQDEKGDETAISFNRATYDPAKYSPANPVLVAVSVTLAHPIDQQATLYANGILLKRARDTFGRAIPAGSGSGGLLEESISIAQANTWMPISRHNILITLDAGQFGAAFPTIQIIDPGQASPVQISSRLPDGVRAVISGQPYECFSKPQGSSNSCRLPSLAYQVPTNTNVGVFLWESYCDPDPKQGCVDKLVLQAPAVATSSNIATGTSVQVVSGSGANPWGANPEVYLQVPTLNRKQYSLNCQVKGSGTEEGGNLVCQFWDGDMSADFSKYGADDLHLSVIDQNHVGGSLVAGTVLPGSAWGRNASSHPSQRLWGASNPQWYDDANGGHWEFKLRFANADKNSVLDISPNPNPGDKSLKTMSCDDQERLCAWKFIVAVQDISKWFNRMDLSFEDDPDDLWHLLNIRSQISPYVTVMSSDYSSWSGNNFTQVFSSVQDPTKKTGLVIGTNPTPIPIECPVLNSCLVSDKTKLPKDPGVMYLMALNQKFPLLQINADGTTQAISFQPQKNTNTNAGGQPPATSANGSTNPLGPSTQIQNTIVLGGPIK
jgi:hypothetical protein